MEFSSQTLVPGVRFSPNDQQLVQYYLYPKVTKPLFTTSAPIRECDLYAYQPLQIWNKFHRIQGEDVFLFTKLKKKSPTSNVRRKIAGGPASWHREDNGKDFSVTIDKHYSVTAKRKVFSYKGPETGHHGCSWTMYEYSLPSLSQDTVPSHSQDTVLCRMRKSIPQKTRKWRRHAGGVDDATNTMSQQARVGEGFDHQQQITAAPAETESEIPNRVKLDNLDKFLQNDDIDNDQMDVSPKELEDLRRELGELLSPDLADGLPSIQTTPEANANRSYVVQENGVEMIYNAFPNSNGW